MTDLTTTTAPETAAKNSAPYGHLCDYETAEIIRPATHDELMDSLAAGDTGVILVDGRSVYCDAS